MFQDNAAKAVRPNAVPPSPVPSAGLAGDPLDSALAESDRQLQAVEARLRTAGGASGMLPAAAHHHFAAGGKRFRARLTLVAARLSDMSEDDAVAAATAVELIHNASLVHDDIMDGDTQRRGRATVGHRYGTGTALLLGDRLLAAAFAQAARTSRPAETIDCLSQQVRRLIDGQALEDAAVSETTPAEALHERYIETARGKAGALFALPLDTVRTLSGDTSGSAERVVSAFRTLGTAYQVQDDIADLAGTKDGRSRATDLWRGRLTAPVVQHLRHAAPREDGALRAFLRQEARTAEDVAFWRDRIVNGPGWDATRRLRQSLLDEVRWAGASLREPQRALLAWSLDSVHRQGMSAPRGGRA